MVRSILTIAIFTMAFHTLSNSQGRPRPVVWADCELFASVVTPNTLPVQGNFDNLYMMPGHTFNDGVPLISESKPGDQDYNGGRWHVFVLRDGVDAGQYANACRVEDLNLGDFEATDDYFGCPLRPRRGNNH